MIGNPSGSVPAKLTAQRISPIVMLFAGANLLTGLLAGLQRIGWDGGVPQRLSGNHGVLMVGGFLGTLILLEKVIPLRNRYFLIIPGINALSIVFHIVGLTEGAITCLVVGSAGMVLVMAIYVVRQPRDLSLLIMLAGAMLLTTGHLVLVTTSLHVAALPWWIGFVLFIIVGERLELSKFLPVGNRVKLLLVCLLVLFAFGLMISFHQAGKYVCGAAMILISCWLLRYDIVAIGLSKKGLTRYSAIALLGGYIWLMITGFLIAFPLDAAFGYDIFVHSFFIGFVFSMIFAHGPIILPGVLGFLVHPFSRALFLPLSILWLSLILRILADIFILPYELRTASGWLSVVGILLYFITLATVTFRALRKG